MIPRNSILFFKDHGIPALQSHSPKIYKYHVHTTIFNQIMSTAQQKRAKVLIKQESQILKDSVNFYKYRDSKNPMYDVSKSNLNKFKDRINKLSSTEIVQDYKTKNDFIGNNGPKEKAFGEMEYRYIKNKLIRLQGELDFARQELEMELEQVPQNKTLCKYLKCFIHRKDQELTFFKINKGL